MRGLICEVNYGALPALWSQ